MYDWIDNDAAFEQDKPLDECGIIGIYAPGKTDIARNVYFGLHALQHRGQDSAGIAVNAGGKIQYYKERGLVQEVFNDEIIERLKGDIAIGHVRYPAKGDTHVINAMPLVVYYKGGALALAHNGSIVNADVLKEEMQEHGAIFQTSVDVEIIAVLIAKHLKDHSIEEAALKTLRTIKGAYALVMTAEEKLIGIRDPHGIRPLCIGKTKEGFVLSSESCAFSLLEAKLVRDVQPGEMVVIENNEIKSYQFSEKSKQAGCSFEYTYIARPDSDIDTRNVYMARSMSGRMLAKEAPVEADLVISVPDSGTVAAIGYAAESGIPYGEGFIKNRYIGRTFIQPDQRMRKLSVRLKLNVITDNVKGKRIVMVDDSLVRGTTSTGIVKMLIEAGAKEVHVRVASPPVTSPCFFGIDTSDKKELIASTKSIDEICEMIGANSLAYLSIEAMKDAIALGDVLCFACFDGKYPIEVPNLEE
ncbi:MAG: amidophosphoribosyltransferase [Clostridiales bacterium]|nr:amidophosphoribosyltransferase [Clostridiales bacterium]